MAVFKTSQIKKTINGKEVFVSESVIINSISYNTNGENYIVVKDVNNCLIFLNSDTSDHVIIKSLTNVLVKSNELIDEEFNEVELNKGACVEFKKIGDYWYILSSDGLKNS
jgi:hypothetical protein